MISNEPVIKKNVSQQASNEKQIVIKCSDGNQIIFPKRKLSAHELEENKKEFERLLGKSNYPLKIYQESVYEEEVETKEKKAQREKMRRENQVQNFNKFTKENNENYTSQENDQMIGKIPSKASIRIKNNSSKDL